KRPRRSSQESGRPHRSARGGGVAADARGESAAGVSRRRAQHGHVAVPATAQPDERARPGAVASTYRGAPFGYRRLHILLEREWLVVNKRVHGLYRAAGLRVRRHRGGPLAAGLRVTRVLDRVGAAIALPQTVVVDNGSEFAGRMLHAWAYTHGVALRFIRPGKPIENVRRKHQRQVPRRMPERA